MKRDAEWAVFKKQQANVWASTVRERQRRFTGYPIAESPRRQKPNWEVFEWLKTERAAFRRRLQREAAEFFVTRAQWEAERNSHMRVVYGSRDPYAIVPASL